MMSHLVILVTVTCGWRNGGRWLEERWTVVGVAHGQIDSQDGPTAVRLAPLVCRIAVPSC